MVIELIFHDSLKSWLPSSSSGVVTVDVIGDITVGELLDELEVDRTKIGKVVVNGGVSSLRQILYDGDKINIYDIKDKSEVI